MSFYNADPRAYFNIYADVTWDSVWGKQEESPSKNLTWKDSINNYEIGRLIRIKNGESKSSANYNNQIFVVEYGKNDIIYNKKNNLSDEQLSHKYLKPLDLTNPYSMAIGEGVNADKDNLTVVGQYNAAAEDGDLFIVGDGSSEDSRSNALRVSTKETEITGDLVLPLLASDGTETEEKAILAVRQGSGQSSDSTENEKFAIYINGEKIVAKTETISSKITISDTYSEGMTLATVASEDETTHETTPLGKIKFPLQITQAMGVDGALTVSGNLNAQGAAAFADKVQVGGANEAAPSNLNYGKYNIQIVEELPEDASSNTSTIYIVLDNT